MTIESSASDFMSVYEEARAGSVKPSGILRGLRAVAKAFPCLIVNPARPEPVAMVGPSFSLLWASRDTMESIAARHDLRVGTHLYSERAVNDLTAELALAKANAARVDWRAAVEEIRQGLAATHLSTSDDAGYRNYAEVVLDRLADILAAQEKT